MAFKLVNFYSEEANVKSILGGVRYFKYWNEDGDTISGTVGYWPDNLGLKLGDRIAIIPKASDLPTTLDDMEGVIDDAPGQVTTKTLV